MVSGVDLKQRNVHSLKCLVSGSAGEPGFRWLRLWGHEVVYLLASPPEPKGQNPALNSAPPRRGGATAEGRVSCGASVAGCTL